MKGLPLTLLPPIPTKRENSGLVPPLAPQRFSLQLTIGQGTYDNLQYAKALASHQIPSGDVAEVIDRALQAFIRELERVKFAATSRPGQGRRTASRRHIPAGVKRTVWERDQGQCTFVSEAGHRCPSRRLLEYDHVDPVARGGQATVAGIRLRCRPHNIQGSLRHGAVRMSWFRREPRSAMPGRTC